MRAMAVSARTSLDKSSKLTGGRRTWFMRVGRESRNDFGPAERGPEDGTKKVTEKLWVRTSRLANSPSGMR